MEGRVGGARGMGNRGRTGRARDRVRVPAPPERQGRTLRGRAQLLGPTGQGSDIWTEWESSILPLGSREEPSPNQLCKQEEEEVPSLPLGEGREGWSGRRRAGPRGAGCASLLGARRRNLLQQQATAGAPSSQRRSGWAGEREGKAGGRRSELVGRPGVAA